MLEARPAPPVYRPQQVNPVGVQPKSAGHSMLEARPAPPVYRPVQTNQPVLQSKPANHCNPKVRPAPPVYRPTVTQHAIGRTFKSEIQCKPTVALETRPAPPVYRPGVVQQKMLPQFLPNVTPNRVGQLQQQTFPPAVNSLGHPRALLQPSSCLQLMKFDTGGNRRWVRKVAYNTENEAHFNTWIGQLELAGDWAKLEKIYTELNTHGKSFHTLKAASRIKRILIQHTEATTPTAAPVSLNQLTINHLPKNLWWKLFIDRSKHRADQTEEQNALRFDGQQSPGFYNMMMSAFEQRLPGAYNNPQAMNFNSYDAYHVLVTRGAVRRRDNGTFEAVPHELSGAYTQFPMTQADEPEAQALLELIGEGVAGTSQEQVRAYNNLGIEVLRALGQGMRAALEGNNDLTPEYRGLYTLSRPEGLNYLVQNLPSWNIQKNKFARAAYATVKKQQQMGQGFQFLSRFTRSSIGGNQFQVSIRTAINEESAPAAVDGIFNTYRLEVQAVGRDAKLRAICKAVRALHVGHFFADANGRLNTMLILNQLLMEQGFSPTIVSDNSWFGGSKTLDTLVDMVEDGMEEFKEEVRVAHHLPVPMAVPLIVAAPIPVIAMPAPGRARARSFDDVRKATVPPAVQVPRARSLSASSL
jgi:hypothetical protein